MLSLITNWFAVATRLFSFEARMKDFKTILQALDDVQTELYEANKRADRDAIAEISERMTTLIQCLDFQALIEQLEARHGQ